MTDLNTAKSFVSNLELAQMAPDELAHHGVLGMHWGVIRDRASTGNKRAIKQLAKGDKKWENELNSTKGYINVHNHMAEKMNNGLIDQFNKTHAKPGVNYLADSPASRAYLSAYEKLSNKVFADSVKELYGDSPSGKKKAVIEIDPQSKQPYLRIIDVNIKHEDSADKKIKLIINKDGKIIKLGEIVKDTLAHYGVLGMKWGRHLPGRSDESHNPKPQKRREAHPDHADTHYLAKKPISTLSTSELQRVNSRLQAEKKYKDLNPNAIKRGKDIYKSIIALGAASAAVVALSQTPAGKLAVKSGKAFVDNLLQGNGKHVLRTVTVKTAKHLV